ncbi:serine protease inhibitor 28Dc-like [Drosophila albomicans]|uniref:Serine protease inhibitor 28Dc-like n=1 Tax=Drosophila albomicans TaxID=7291 RepID=A0A6P8XCB9_DROAB|nr:serine protease inhibitor 28Dc-like [Drosophila albomicans]
MLHSMNLVTLALAYHLLVGISQAQGPYGIVDVPASHLIAEDVMNLGLKLMTKQMAGVYADTFLISPVSIASALASLLLAAKGGSFIELSKQFRIKDTVKLHEQFGYMLRNAQQTYNDITYTLSNDPVDKRIKKEVKETQQVFIGSGLFVQQDHSINLDYRQALAQIYNSEIYPVDFEKDPATAVDLMNVWVTQKTKSKITNIVNLYNINNSTRMTLTNTMYFNARWINNFYETRSEPFYPDGYDSKTKLYVPTMVATGSYTFDLNKRRDCLILGIPYRGSQNTLYIIQPFQSSIRRLKKFQKSLTAESIEEMISKMRSIHGKIRLPKMRIIGGDHLKYQLNDFGIKGIFSNKNYDLSLIASGNSSTQLYQSDAVGNLKNLETQRKFAESEPRRSADLYIMDIIHKVRLDVTEKGTEGASATEASMSRTIALVDFVINSPFILLVRNDFTKLPLFYGIINKPPS